MSDFDERQAIMQFDGGLAAEAAAASAREDAHRTDGEGLRPYQAEAVEALRRSIASGRRAPVLVAPTGSGKTHIAKALIVRAVAKLKRVLFLAPRKELIYQTAEKLDRAGIHNGIYMAGESRDLFAPVQVASTPTLYTRFQTHGRSVLPPADLVIQDEAHLAISASSRAIMAAYPDAVKIGLTATPVRGDGRGLGEMFDDLVLGPSVADLMAEGHLVPARYYAPTKPDLEGVKVQMGDYNQKQLGERMDREMLIGDVVTNWLRIAPNRQTIAFGVNVAHAVHLRDCFREAGILAEHLDAHTLPHERRDIVERFERQEVQVVTNCQIFSYGVDIPPASCCILAHPTKSLARYLQAVGRVLRPYPGKTEALVIDHAGIVDELGFVDDDFPWALDGKGRIQERRAALSVARKAPKPLTCPECKAVFEGQALCPECGHRMAQQWAKAIEAVDAELAEVDRRTKDRKKREWSQLEKQQFYSELLGLARQRGYKDGWAYHKFHERLGVYPSGRKEPAEPSPETLSWVKSRQIAWAKRKDREARHAAA